MTTWWRWTLALLLCGVGAVTLGPGAAVAAPATPAVSAGVGTVVADLGEVRTTRGPGFSPDGAYYAYLAPVGEECELRLFDLLRRAEVDLGTNRVGCFAGAGAWATRATALAWRLDAADGTGAAFAWDPATGVRAVIPRGVGGLGGLSADGRYLAYGGPSDGDPALTGWRVVDRATGVDRFLSVPGATVEFTEWGPTGHRFVADTVAEGSGWRGTCFGTGTSCDVVTSYTSFGDQSADGGQWSPDGTAVLGFDQVVFDFTDEAFTPFPRGIGFSGDPVFLDDERVGGPAERGAFLWNRRTGDLLRLPSLGAPSPDGRYLLIGSRTPDVFRYRNVRTGAEAPATYRGSTVDHRQLGYWVRGGSSFLGLGPGGCSSLRQWSPASNTVSLYGPPGLRTCFEVPYPRTTSTWGSAFRTFSSASGRFALIMKHVEGVGDRDVVVDLRRHVLLGPLEGEAQGFAPAGGDLLVVAQPRGLRSRLLLVDPTPAPDVDDKPRWTRATPPNGARVEVAPGGRVQVELGASEPKAAPVNLFLRWRDGAGVPIKSAPRGWSCDRQRLAAGATRAVCTFAPPARDWTATRFLDVSVTNHATGAQSGTRSYRVAVAR